MPQPCIYQDHFPYSGASRGSDGLLWEYLQGVTVCGVSALIPPNDFLLYLHYYSFFQDSDQSRTTDFLTSFEAPRSYGSST